MPFEQVTIQAEAAKRARNFDCWIFRDELVAPVSVIPAGEIVEAVDTRGAFVAYAFFHPTAHIALRVLGREREIPPDKRFVAGLIDRAIARRARITQTNARRLVFSEADALPGLIVDHYDRWLVLQIRTAGMERFRGAVVDTLQKRLSPAGILERSDKEFRREESLPERTEVLAGEVPPQIEIQEYDLRFIVDPYRGHKTGFYLDQRDTRQWVASRVQNGERVADVFAYTGTFGIACAKRGARVVCVDRHEPSLPLIEAQAKLNGVADKISTVAGDAFYWLEAKAKTNERFDWVLLDPPALAKSKPEAAAGRQALHHLVANGLQLLKPDGNLVVSVCTYHLLNVTEEVIRIAASKAGIRLAVRGVTMQAEDHPWILQVPATRYLMSWTVRRAE